jgi:crossover junction endodeoxyribonuclease RuvC
LKIAVFDVATSVGLCVGKPGAKQPFVATWDLRAAGTARPRRLLYFSNLCDKLFAENSIDEVWYEKPMAINVASRVGATEETMLLLRGAIGVLEVCAERAEIKIDSFGVQDARHHFVGQRTFPKGKNGKSAAKDMVLIKCDEIGIKVTNDNEADSVAGWSYVCALKNPKLAVLTTPLYRVLFY